MNAMELDQNSVFLIDYVFVLCLLQLIFVTCFTIAHRLRARWPLKVNCWFCNKNAKIWKQNQNWWLCPFCEQYNGFSKNGDYTYDIPEQYAVPNNYTRYCSLPKQNDISNVPKSNLCIDCNERQNMKLLELSTFEPRHESLYNLELKAFKEYLEKKYPLCGNCRSVIQDVLRKQAIWLTYYKMLFFKQKPVKAIINNARKSERIFRYISIVLNLIIAYNHDLIWLPIGGLFSHLCACCASSMKKKHLDVSLIIVWCCTIILILIKNLTTLQNVWFTAEHITQYHMIILCTLLIGFLNIKHKLYSNASVGTVAFKKLKWHTRDVAKPHSAYDNRNETESVLSETNSNVESLANTANEFSVEFKSHSATLRQKSFTTTKSSNDNHRSSAFSGKNDLPDYYNLNDSLNTLNALSLSEDSPRYSVKTPPIFERRVYSTTNCDLFKRFGTASSKRYILSPPKLRSVTQTSWVAGGYWQEGMMSGGSTISRSSSQSSGFGSAGSSNFAPSREPSVHEFDQCSVVSDVMNNLGRPVYNSPVSCAQSRCSMYDATTRKNHSRSHLPIQAYNTTATEKRVETPINGPGNSIPIYPSHTTIVTSSGWLSVLLCGSLILNMIVLYTMLLR